MLQLTRIPGYNGRFVNISPSENPSEDLVEDFVEYYIFDLTLTDEDTNSILTDDANKEISSNLKLLQVPPPGAWCPSLQPNKYKLKNSDFGGNFFHFRPQTREGVPNP